MSNKLVVIICEALEECSVAYINGEYKVGEYYFSLEAIVWTAKALDPAVEIEIYSISEDAFYNLEDGYPSHLPDDFVNSWQLEKYPVQDV